METRLATAADAPALASLHAASFSHGVWSLAQITDSLALATTSTWVAVASNDIKGFLMLQQAGDEAEILTFCTSPQMRGQGVGTLLVQTALASTHAAKNTKIFLEVAADNIVAQKLYEKNGFKITGKRANYYRRGNDAVDALMLVLEI